MHGCSTFLLVIHDRLGKSEILVVLRGTGHELGNQGYSSAVASTRV